MLIEKKMKRKAYTGFWYQSDDDALYDMIMRTSKGNFSIKDIRQYPFLWTPHETLMFIVEVVKRMEPFLGARNYPIVEEIFKTCTKNVLSGEDWRSRTLEIVEIQTKANNGVRPHKSLIGLLKIIRNLVNFQKMCS